MNKNRNEGASLIEVLVAIALLALITVSTAAGLILSHRINARSEELLQAQLRLSSCLEILREEGIDSEQIQNSVYIKPVCPGVTVQIDPGVVYTVTAVDDATGQTLCTRIGGAT